MYVIVLRSGISLPADQLPDLEKARAAEYNLPGETWVHLTMQGRPFTVHFADIAAMFEAVAQPPGGLAVPVSPQTRYGTGFNV